MSSTDGTGDGWPCETIVRSPAKAIDTTGAGDAFNGSLAASLAQRPHLAFAEHIRFASRYAGLSTETEGAALAMPRLPAG